MNTQYEGPFEETAQDQRFLLGMSTDLEAASRKIEGLIRPEILKRGAQNVTIAELVAAIKISAFSDVTGGGSTAVILNAITEARERFGHPELQTVLGNLDARRVRLQETLSGAVNLEE